MCEPYHSRRFRQIQRNGFLAEYGLSGLDRDLDKPGVRLRWRNDDNRIDAGMANRFFDIRQGNFSASEDFATLGRFSIRVGNCNNSHPAQSHQISQVSHAHASHAKKGHSDRVSLLAFIQRAF